MSTSPSPQAHTRTSILAGRYAIRRKLGSGSLGTVYLARDVYTRRPVALKVISTEGLIGDAVAHMQQEFQAIASLRHPQIASAYDFGYIEEGSVPFYTREYIQGSPLSPGPPWGRPARAFLRPIVDLLEALRYLHDHETLHLDIHAGNLIVADDPDRGGVLIDFGIPRSLEEPRLSVSAAMPPEIAGGGQAVPQSDLFLVGRLLLYRLTGRAGGRAQLPREIPRWGSRLTLELERILQKALNPAVKGRFQSALEFRDALCSALGETAVRPSGEEPNDLTLGREKELEAVEEALRDAASGLPALVWFAGDHGLGKTRLLSEARLRAQLRGLDVVEAAFLAVPGAGPVLVNALRSRWRRRPRWVEALASRHGGTPQARAQRAADSFFAEEAPPQVLLVDDLHLADGQSQVLVDALVSECAARRQKRIPGHGVALIVTSTALPPRRVEKRALRRLRPLRPGEAGRLFRAYLRPLKPPKGLVERAVVAAEGSPLGVRRLAVALKGEWERSGVIPETAELPPLLPETQSVGRGLPRVSPLESEVYATLAAVGRPMSREELSAALEIEGSSVRSCLRRLVKVEAVSAHGRGVSRRYWLSPAEGETIATQFRRARLRRIHLRLADLITRKQRRSPRDRESLARHLLAAGRRSEGIGAALQAAQLLRKNGSFDRAVRLLEQAGSGKARMRERLVLAEEISSIAEESGDHDKGISVMEPFYRGEKGRLLATDAVRVRRRLGLHYHRSGRAEKALAVFEEAQRRARPARDMEDLIFIDSELAELYIFRGRHDDADAACRRGLERAGRLPGGEEFRSRMEVVLRASLGHLELRRLSLVRAREELEAALRLSRRFGTTAERAAILTNLGVAENQMNEFSRARNRFLQAERILLGAGKRRSVIKIATNLAVIAAKLGDRDEARLQVERAAQLVRHYPGERLEFFVTYSRAIVACLFGEVRAAVEALATALPLGRKLGDGYLVSFGEVYLAEACLASGRYLDALRALEEASRRAEKEGPPLLLRMVHSRLFLVESLLGRRRRAARSEKVLEETARTDVVLLEVWNDLFTGLGRTLSGESDTEDFRRAIHTFRRLKVSFGERFARVLCLLEALSTGKKGEIRRQLEEMGERRGGPHLFLSVAEPLAKAEALLSLGEIELAETWLAEASGAIVGSSFLELDWRIEFLRARIALRRRDTGDARRQLHRSLHTRDLLSRLVPPRARERFLSHPRFAGLNELASRLENIRSVHWSTEQLRRSEGYAGIVGRSSAMVRVFQTIERLRGQDISVLLRGETGTGKDLVARAIHDGSLRRQGPFLEIHCAALPAELFESELFGFEAQAFTGAQEGRPGLLETAEGGTLLLDEVAQLSETLQAKLLRFLDSGRFRRLGGRAQRRVDVRLISSTSADLEEAVRNGKFRADLYYRVRGVEIRLPPLRERRGDVPVLAKHFLEEHAQRLDRPVQMLREDAVALLESHSWPGNVREFETVLLRVLISMSRPETIGAPQLRAVLLPERRPLVDKQTLESRELEDLKLEVEREYLAHLFASVRGDPEKMMQKLGLKRTQLYARFRKLGLDVRELRRELPQRSGRGG
ncbi:MAG: sigma 54-interacting transcriptional regulator [Planctomycetota bacterium]|nr:sigma 54-interacting transcriptional regulator [Planctomycetota bacterium]